MACTESPDDALVVPATDAGDRLDIIARAVALVASLPLSDAERAAVLDRVVHGTNPPGTVTGGGV